MSPRDHDQQRALVEASVASTHQPDVYRKRFPSRATVAAAERLGHVLAKLESGDEDAREEFIRARAELRARVHAERPYRYEDRS